MNSLNNLINNHEIEDVIASIINLLGNALTHSDETNRELANDLLDSAINYAKYRMDFATHDTKWKSDNDRYRTSAHNRFMDCLNIFLRYNKRQTMEKYDRKDLGDIACYLAYAVAISEK